MPVYVYECDSCGGRYERVHGANETPMKRCPKCRNSVHRVIFPVGIIFKGPGFHITDYGRGNGKARSKPPTPGDNGKERSESTVGSKSDGE